MPPRQNDTRSSASQQRSSRNGGQNRNGQRTGNPRGNQRGNGRSGASQTTQRRVQPAASGPIPLWAWIILILIIGVLLGKHFLTSSHPEKPQEGNASIMTRSTTGNASTATNGNTDQKNGNGQTSGDNTTKMPSFEFYTLLPESEVIAPDIPSTQNNAGATTAASGNGSSTGNGASASNNGSANSAPHATATTPSNQNTASNNTRPAAKPATPPRQTASTNESGNTTNAGNAGNANASSSFGGVSYMLQAASFKSQSDANAMASNFRQMGLTMQVTQVQTSDGTTWYRVQAGPFTDSNALTHARSVMQTKGIDALTIRQR